MQNEIQKTHRIKYEAQRERERERLDGTENCHACSIGLRWQAKKKNFIIFSGFMYTGFTYFDCCLRKWSPKIGLVFGVFCPDRSDTAWT